MKEGYVAQEEGFSYSPGVGDDGGSGDVVGGAEVCEGEEGFETGEIVGEGFLREELSERLDGCSYRGSGGED